MIKAVTAFNNVSKICNKTDKHILLLNLLINNLRHALLSGDSL